MLGIGGGSAWTPPRPLRSKPPTRGPAGTTLFFKTPPTPATLPVIAVSTTSGTGSQVTQVAVVTQTATQTKSALYNSLLYPRVAIVDPELMVTVPPHVTASTGFDVFCHAFESYLHPAAHRMSTCWHWKRFASRELLPRCVDDGKRCRARAHMAWADTLAGLCIANAGVTLPHGIGMTIGGQCPQVMHGEALAVTYPEFSRYTSPYAVQQFAAVGRIFNPAWWAPPMSWRRRAAARRSTSSSADRHVAQPEGAGCHRGRWRGIADHSRVLPDYKNNPRIADRDEIF